VQYPNTKFPNTDDSDLSGVLRFINLLHTSYRPYFVSVLCIVQAVGILGFMNTVTRDYFKLLVPGHLIGCLALIIWSLRDDIKGKLWIIAVVGTLGLLIEMLGVNTGLIFGNYEYGSVLGFKLFNTPLLIGVNWLILVLSCIGFLQGLRFTNRLLIVVVVAALLTLLDVIVEPVAINLGFWSWEGGVVPFQNYLGWFISALLLTSIVVLGKIKLSGSLAIVIWWLEVSFFALLWLNQLFV
jgi:putative membrane protein